MFPSEPSIGVNAMRQDPAAYYRLANDIDLTRTAAWNTGRGWEPVAGSAAGTRFTGGLDGAGFALRNLVVSRPTTTYQGLFAYLEGATIRDLGLESAHVDGGQYSGMLAGYASGGTIETVAASGLVHGTSSRIGGLFGYGASAVVASAAVDTVVLGTAEVGGLAGYLSGGEVRLSVVRGSVTGSSTSVGGLAGYVSTTLLVDNHSRAAVTAGGQAGGFIGYFSSGTASRCFSTGLVTGAGTFVGGFSGRNSSGVAYDCLWDTEASGQETSAHGEGKDTTLMRQRATYPRYNFQTVWEIDEGVGYPELRDMAGYPQPPVVALADLPGSGTVADPYLISTPGELNAMRQDRAAHYRLANDIDLGQTAAWDAGRGWTPVGGSASGTRFTGTFDGAGFVLRNLVVNRPTTTYQGFFGYLDGARVRNLTLENADVHGGQYSGALSGYANASVLHNLRADVMIAGTSANAGGMVGYLNGGAVRHCGVSGNVTGTTSVGGLTGYLATGIVTDCYNRAEVAGTSQVGGLIGYHASGSIYRCHSNSAVTFATTYGGGLTGRGLPASTIDCYWDTEASGMATSAGGSGLDSAAMRRAASFRNHNFTTLWEIDEGESPPTIRPLHHLPQPQPVMLAELDGSGTDEDPYLIGTPDALNTMRQDLAAHYQLTADIDLAASVAWLDGEGWLPVGDATLRFTGSLDGAGHAIRHLVINRPTTTYQGLFGYTSGASIANLRLEDTHIHAAGFAGTIAGLALNSQITTCQSHDHVLAGRGASTGGLVGHQNGGAIRHVAVRCSTTGLDRTGGVVGYLSGANALLQYASSHGSVAGALSVGGLVGELNNASAVVADAFSHAEVSGTDRCGGLLGYLNGGTVRRGYSIGTVTAGGSFTGGFLGRLASGNIRSCYWDAQRSGMVASAAGESRSTREMSYPHDLETTYLGWNFRQWWSEDGDFSINGGYPYLRMDLPPFDVFANSILLDDFPAVVCEVAVIARDGSPVTGLTAANFTVTEQGPDDPEPIVCAVTVEEIPVEEATISVVLVFDTSGSMGSQQMADAKEAAISFIGNLRPGDKVGVVEFKSTVIVRTPPIDDLDAVTAIIQSLSATGGTAMFDGIYDGVTLLEELTGSRCVIVFTDGDDNASKNNKTSTIDHALATGVPVFTIALGAGVSQQDILEEIADATGGAFFNAPEAADLYEIYMQIAISQRPQYRITYTSPHPEVDGTLRAVHISVTYDGVTVTDRRSYGIARTIAVAADPPGAGTPGGGGLYADGSMVTLTPNPALGWQFVEWSEHGTVISTNQEFTFEVHGDRSFVAHYEPAIHTLTYLAGPGGMLTGPTVQQVTHGQDAAPVAALPEPGAVFFTWSDGVPTAGRTDTQVQGPLTVTARFRSTGGVDIEWFLDNGFEPGDGETWADLDNKDPIGKGNTLLEDFLAGTDPRDPASRFDARVVEITPGGEVELDWFSAPGKTYGIEWATDAGNWSEVESQPGVPLRVPAAPSGARTSFRFPSPVMPPPGRMFFRAKVVP